MGKTIHNFDKKEIHSFLFYDELTVEQIAKKYNCHPSTITNFLIKNGLKVKKGLSGFIKSII